MKTKLATVTIASEKWLIPIGRLQVDDLLVARHELIRHIKPLFIGALDISVNDDLTHTFQTHYGVHVHGIVESHCKIRRKLEEHFIPTKQVPRPITMSVWDHRSNWLAYILKPTFERRLSYLDGNKLDRAPHRNTSRKPLRVAEHVELMLALDELGFAKRLILRGAKLVRTSNGPRLVRITGLRRKAETGRETGQ